MTSPSPQPTLRVTLRGLVCANALALLCAGSCGAALAVAQGRRVEFTRQADAAGVSFTQMVVEVARGNGRVLVHVAAGIVSFGAAGTVVLVINGFRFGMDAAAVAVGSPQELRFVLPHGFLEFVAFTLAAAASQYLGWLLFQLLAFNRRGTGAAVAAATLVASAGLGLLAAVVESWSHVARLS